MAIIAACVLEYGVMEKDKYKVMKKLSYCHAVIYLVLQSTLSQSFYFTVISLISGVFYIYVKVFIAKSQVVYISDVSMSRRHWHVRKSVIVHHKISWFCTLVHMFLVWIWCTSNLHLLYLYGLFVVLGVMSHFVFQHQKTNSSVCKLFSSLFFFVISQTKHGLQFTKDTIQPSPRRKMGRKDSGNSLSCWMVWYLSSHI